MNKQDRIFAIWGMNGRYYDAIMNTIPTWLTYADDEEFDANFDDWFFSQIGM